ncbi:MAG: LLM class flavin-dependent oxidoreductase [Acidimicrobiales bacterium]
MRVAVTGPSFRDDGDDALTTARRAEEMGLDGVFVFDHLWPIGQPERPAIAAFPLLGALVAATDRICVGTLVARVGLVPDETLVAELVALGRLAPGRVVAGLGTGDALSASENIRAGIPYTPAADRRGRLRRCAEMLTSAGMTVWIGGGAPEMIAIATELGVAVNLWDADPGAIRALSATVQVTWAGPMQGPPSAVATRLDEIEQAGASWAVCSPSPSIEVLGEAVALRR